MSDKTDQQIQNILYETRQLNQALLHTVNSLQVSGSIHADVANHVKLVLERQASRLSALTQSLLKQ